MEAQEKLRAVEEWQANVSVHPLTCGNSSAHAPLVGFIDDGEAKLKCLDCDYQQDFIPKVVLESYEDKFDDESDFEIEKRVVRKMPKLQ